jgi:hypothetical protein
MACQVRTNVAVTDAGDNQDELAEGLEVHALDDCWESGGPPALFEVSLTSFVLAFLAGTLWFLILAMRAAVRQPDNGAALRLPPLLTQCAVILAIAYSGWTGITGAPNIPHGVATATGAAFVAVTFAAGLPLALMSTGVTSFRWTALRTVPMPVLAPLPALATALLLVGLTAAAAQTALGHHC